MPLGMELNLGPGNVLLDGVAAPPLKGPCLLWPQSGTYRNSDTRNSDTRFSGAAGKLTYCAFLGDRL